MTKKKKPLTVALSGRCAIGMRGGATPANTPLSGRGHLKTSATAIPAGTKQISVFGDPGGLETEADIAKKAVRQKDSKGGKNRWEGANEVPWYARALELAIKIRADHPTVPRANIARRVFKDWGDTAKP